LSTVFKTAAVAYFKTDILSQNFLVGMRKTTNTPSKITEHFAMNVTQDVSTTTLEAKKQRHHVRYGSISTGYGLDGPRSIPGSVRFLSSPQLPDRLWGPPSLLSNGHRGEGGRCVKLTTHLHLMPRSRKVELYLHSPYVFMALLLFTGAPAHVGPRPPLMRFRNLTLIDGW
jgi:hypothetical protein